MLYPYMCTAFFTSFSVISQLSILFNYHLDYFILVDIPHISLKFSRHIGVFNCRCIYCFFISITVLTLATANELLLLVIPSFGSHIKILSFPFVNLCILSPCLTYILSSYPCRASQSNSLEYLLD